MTSPVQSPTLVEPENREPLYFPVLCPVQFLKPVHFIQDIHQKLRKKKKQRTSISSKLKKKIFPEMFIHSNKDLNNESFRSIIEQL